MLITRVIKQQEDGTFQATMSLTEEQTAFLINFALGILVQEGSVKFMDPDKEGAEQQAQSDFLNALAPKEMPQA